MKKFLLGLVLMASISAGGVLVAQNTLDKYDGDISKMAPRDKISRDGSSGDCNVPSGHCR